MDKYQSIKVSFVSTQNSVRWSNQVVPINDQRHYSNNTESSSNNQFTGMSRDWGAKEWKASNPTIITASKRFSQFENSNAKDTADNRRKTRLNAWLVFAGILLTVLTLPAIIMSIYLLVITITTPTSTTGIPTTMATTTFTTTTVTTILPTTTTTVGATFCNNCTVSGVSCVNHCVGLGYNCHAAAGVDGTCISGGGNSCISLGINSCINGAGSHVGCDAPFGNYTCCC